MKICDWWNIKWTTKRGTKNLYSFWRAFAYFGCYRSNFKTKFDHSFDTLIVVLLVFLHKTLNFCCSLLLGQGWI